MHSDKRERDKPSRTARKSGFQLQRHRLGAGPVARLEVAVQQAVVPVPRHRLSSTVSCRLATLLLARPARTLTAFDESPTDNTSAETTMALLKPFDRPAESVVAAPALTPYWTTPELRRKHPLDLHPTTGCNHWRFRRHLPNDEAPQYAGVRSIDRSRDQTADATGDLAVERPGSLTSGNHYKRNVRLGTWDQPHERMENRDCRLRTAPSRAVR